MKRQLLRLARSLAVAWLVVVAVMAVWQDSLIYFPARARAEALIAEANRPGLEPWRDTGGEIIGWRKPRAAAAQAAHRLIVFHGNAGYALHRWSYVAGFGALDEGRLWDVHLFEYPGYGARSGHVGEHAFNAAAASAFESLRAEDARPIHLLGESIGSGPACMLAARAPEEVAGLCLVTPLARLADVAAHHYPFLPVRLILRDRWDNVAALTNYRGRLAMRLAGRDEIVPPAQSRMLFDRFSGPKRLWVEPGAGHNTLDMMPANAWWREASDFLLAKP